jgi:hypothetical protein
MKSLTELIPAATNFPTLKENSLNLKTFDKDELKVAEALKTMQIGKCSHIEVKEHLKTCLALSGTQIPSQEIFEFCVQFVIETYGQYKLKELGVAFKLYAEDKLTVGNHINFNPKLIGEVMSSYKKIAIQVRNKIEPQEVKQLPMQIDEEQAIKDEQDYWNKSEQKNWRFLNHQVFDYLWKRKQIKISKEQGENIKAKVRAVFLAQSKKPDDMLIDDETMRQQCKKYSLMMHFNNQL